MIAAIVVDLCYVALVEWQCRVPVSMRYSGVVSGILRACVPNRMVAVTLWTTIWILHPNVTLSPSGYAHERQHTRQWLAHPYLFPLAYAWASVVAWRRGLDPYTGNRYEIEARVAGSYHV